MIHKIKTEWKGDMAFETELNGHKLIVDAPEAVGGQDLGPRPKMLMLTALTGCTGMDVVSILKKMRVNIESCNILVEANVTEEDPKHYDKMHLIYEFSGKDLPMAKLEKAVKMSQDTYCGVSAVYKKAMELTYEIRLID